MNKIHISKNSKMIILSYSCRRFFNFIFVHSTFLRFMSVFHVRLIRLRCISEVFAFIFEKIWPILEIYFYAYVLFAMIFT
jgi:hypothetical protein